MMLHGPHQLQKGSSRWLVTCSAKSKKPGGKQAGKGFGVSSAPTPLSAQKQRRSELRILDDLRPVPVEPESEIDDVTFNSCLFFMNKTEELCGRIPKLLDHEWAQATARRMNDCVSRPILLDSPTHTTALHILCVKHDDSYNPALLAAVWDRVKPDAVALDVQPLYPKSFTRMAKAMDAALMDKLLQTPLTSLTGALDHADDRDRLRWHHAILQVVGQGASPILVTKAMLFNVFANRDLHLSEALAAAHLATRGSASAGGSASSPVPIHGIDVEDAAMLQALGEDDFWTDADSANYRQMLLQAADPQLRSAVNTLLQGIPVGTTTTTPRQRFVLNRLEQALNRQQEEAHSAAHAAYCAAHSEPRVREQTRLHQAQTEHHLTQLRDIAAGRLGGRRCGRLLAVMSSEHARGLRRLLAEAPADAATGAGAVSASG